MSKITHTPSGGNKLLVAYNELEQTNKELHLALDETHKRADDTQNKLDDTQNELNETYKALDKANELAKRSDQLLEEIASLLQVIDEDATPVEAYLMLAEFIYEYNHFGDVFDAEKATSEIIEDLRAWHYHKSME